MNHARRPTTWFSAVPPLRHGGRHLSAIALQLLTASLGATGGLAACGLILRLYPPA